uniref:Vesicle transport protein n=1 Tax=Ascaris suum TaxID=6253 RepID=F1L114_ASCSU
MFDVGCASAMSALQDFVNQQKAKGALGPSSFSASFSSFNELRSKLSSSISGSISGLPLLSRSTTVDLDSESLTDSASTSGQLPSSRNRRNGGWFSSVTGDEGACGLSRVQRIVAFFMALFGAFFCFGMAVVMLPLIVIQARKFAALNTLGSVMLISSFGFLWGPMNYVKHMLSQERRYVTAAYLSTVIATLYTSVWLQSTVVTIIFAVLQAIALIWYVLSYAPGGERGLRFIAGLFGGMLKAQSKTVLPI